jgi:hypothetical protein
VSIELLKTLLHYWYERDEDPYKNPPHYYFDTAKDTSEECKLFIRFLSDYDGKRKKSNPEKYSKEYYNRRGKLLYLDQKAQTHKALERSDKEFLIFHSLLSRNFPLQDCLIDFMWEFNQYGWTMKIIEFFFITLQYTEDFFSEQDVLVALEKYEHDAFKMKKGELTKEWELLKKTRFTKDMEKRNMKKVG